MTKELIKANMAAAKFCFIWQPLFVAHPAPWRVEQSAAEMPSEIIVRDADGRMVCQYNQHSHPGILYEDRLSNAHLLVNTVNNF